MGPWDAFWLPGNRSAESRDSLSQLDGGLPSAGGLQYPSAQVLCVRSKRSLVTAEFGHPRARLPGGEQLTWPAVPKAPLPCPGKRHPLEGRVPPLGHRPRWAWQPFRLSGNPPLLPLASVCVIFAHVYIFSARFCVLFGICPQLWPLTGADPAETYLASRALHL